MKYISLVSNICLFICVVVLSVALIQQKNKTTYWRDAAKTADAQTEKALSLGEECVTIAEKLAKGDLSK